MKLDWFACLCALVETGSFSAAAVRLHRSQPAISQQIRALEKDVGRTLFDRRGGVPTPAGQLVYERARHILNEAGSLSRELEDFDESAGRELRVGTSDTAALHYLPPYVRRFSLAMPRTRLVVVCRSSRAVEEQVLRGELDLGLVTLPAEAEGLETQAVFEQHFVLVAPKGHPVGKESKVSLSRLTGEPFLMLEPGTRTGGILNSYLAAQHFEPQVVLDSGSFEVIRRYVVEGIGLAFLPEALVRDGELPVEKVTVPGLPSVQIGAVWRRHAYQSAAEEAFLKLLKEGEAA
jgi:DNA-binding transcriptional LysR family regulator